MMTVGEVDDGLNGFDPSKMLADWDTGAVTQLDDGRRLRTFEVEAIDKEIEIAPGIMFPAWTHNGRVPGPSGLAVGVGFMFLTAMFVKI